MCSLEVTGQVVDAGGKQTWTSGEPVSPWARWKIGNNLGLCSVVNAMSNSLSLKRRSPGLIERTSMIDRVFRLAKRGRDYNGPRLR